MSKFSCISNSGIELSLSNIDLWKQFPTPMEMIVTAKTGRKLFPDLQYLIKGMDPSKLYEVSLHMERVDDFKYAYKSGEWEKVTRGYPVGPVQPINHNRGIRSGEHWMSHSLTFDQIRITNNAELKKKNHVNIQSMHLWRPVVTIKEVNGSSIPEEFRLDITQFMAVTSYQNPKIIEVKCSNNKFASRQSLKRPMASASASNVSSRKKCPASPPTISPPGSDHGSTSSSDTENSSTTSPMTQNRQNAPINFGTQYAYPMNGAGPSGFGSYAAYQDSNMWNYNGMQNYNWMQNVPQMGSYGQIPQCGQLYPPMNHMGRGLPMDSANQMRPMGPPIRSVHQLGQMPPMMGPPMMPPANNISQSTYVNLNSNYTTPPGYFDPMTFGYGNKWRYRY